MSNPWITYRKLLAREALVSAVINVVLSGGIAWARFGHQPRIPVWGTSGLLLDAVPSTALPVLLMSVALTLIVRQRLKQSPVMVDGPTLVTCLPKSLPMRALALALLSTLLLVAISGFVFTLFGTQWVSTISTMTIKCVQAAVIGLILGPIIVVRTLYERPS